jgi:subtilisin family serine protease
VRLEKNARLADLAAAGLDVEDAPADSALVQGTVDAADVTRLAASAGVAAIRPVDVAIHRIGSATSEGDAGSGADAVRALGLDGSGVTVGVISDGIDSLAAAQASGDLGDVTVPSDPRCARGSGDEGTALLEIVHDLAPGARLLFSGPATSVEMIDSVRCLTAAGADVIVDDIGFLFEPYFEDGPVAAAVRQSVIAGVSYHSAAGNDAETYFEGVFQPTAGNTFHDFNAGGGEEDNTDTIRVPPGGDLLCILQWGDRFGGSGNDYDLYLLDAALNVVDEGINLQEGRDDPVEFVEVVNPSTTDQIAHVVIDRFEGQVRHMKMLCFVDTVPEYVTPTGSVYGHAALAEVAAVGAVDQADPGRDDVETYSSRGPVRLLFPTETTRAKPDLVAFDGVTISNAGGFPSCPPFCRFFGTSAAAPHTAAVAALMLQRSPGLSPASILAALQQGATDIGAPGPDAIAGAGRLDAAASLALVAPGATTTSTIASGTSTTSSSTTTTSPGPAPPTTSTTLADLSCARPCADDGDACTAERCEVGVGCRTTPIGRAEGVVCLLDSLARARECERSEIARGVAAFIGRKTAQAKTHASRSITASPRRYEVHVKRTRALLQQLVRKVEKAGDSGRLSGACQSRISNALARAVSLAESTTF